MFERIRARISAWQKPASASNVVNVKINPRAAWSSFSSQSGRILPARYCSATLIMQAINKEKIARKIYFLYMRQLFIFFSFGLLSLIQDFD